MPIVSEGSRSRGIGRRAAAVTATVLSVAILGPLAVLRVHGIRTQVGPVQLEAGAFGLDWPWPTPILAADVGPKDCGAGGEIATFRIAGAGWFLVWNHR